MHRNWAPGIVGLSWLLTVAAVSAADPPSVPSTPYSELLAQAQPTPAAQPPAQQPAAEPQAQSDAFAQGQSQGPEGTSSSGGGHSNMVGDLNGGIFVRRLVLFPASVNVRVTQFPFSSSVFPSSEAPTRVQFRVPGILAREVNVPLSARGAFKIAENESPFPTDRVFTTYNYFNNVAVLPAGPDRTASLLAPFNVSTLTPAPFTFFGPNSARIAGSTAVPLQSLDLHREVFGFEKTLLTPDFSVGIRLPLLQQVGDPSLESSRIGDVSVIVKYALINDRDSGNVLSGGLAVTAPTGEDAIGVDGRTIHPTLLQPFIGYFVNLGQFYVHGFSSVIVPTDSRDVTFLCNDGGVGYRLYRNDSSSGFIRFVTPTMEGHLTTPLNERGSRGNPVGFPDIFIGTGAVHVGLGDRSTLTLGAGTPLTGPQPFDIEGIVQFNLRF